MEIINLTILKWGGGGLGEKRGALGERGGAGEKIYTERGGGGGAAR